MEEHSPLRALSWQSRASHSCPGSAPSAWNVGVGPGWWVVQGPCENMLGPVSLFFPVGPAPSDFFFSPRWLITAWPQPAGSWWALPSPSLLWAGRLASLRPACETRGPQGAAWPLRFVTEVPGHEHVSLSPLQLSLGVLAEWVMSQAGLGGLVSWSRGPW